MTFDHQIDQLFIELGSAEHFKQFKAWLVEFCQIRSTLKRERTNDLGVKYTFRKKKKSKYVLRAGNE